MYAQDKLATAKIKKGNNSVITCDIVTILALCTSSIKFHLIPFCTFRDMLRTSFLLQKLKKLEKVKYN